VRCTSASTFYPRHAFYANARMPARCLRRLEGVVAGLLDLAGQHHPYLLLPRRQAPDAVGEAVGHQPGMFLGS
jgi:hypothetical protein